MARCVGKKPLYRLRFQHTRSTRKACTMKDAIADARYWLDFGQVKVCIDKRLPSGRYEQVRCLSRKKSR